MNWVGMFVAILVDATLVRALLVPATMRLLGGELVAAGGSSADRSVNLRRRKSGGLPG